MVDVALLGASSSKHWETKQILNAEGGSFTVLISPDAATEAKTFYVSPTAPLLVRRVNGEPAFSLTLVLSRQPKPEEETIYPLIEQGIVGFDLKLGVPAWVLEQLKCMEQRTYQRLFARDVQFELLRRQNDTEGVLVSRNASGTEARAAINATLDRSETLSLLSALEGNASKLKLRAQVTYRVAATNQKIRIYGSWAKIHDFLSTRLDANGELTLTTLRKVLQEMLNAAVLVVYRADNSSEKLISNPDSQAIFDVFMRLSSVIFQRRFALTPDSETRYVLRGRPHESFYLNYRQTISGPNQETVILEAPLQEVIGGILRGRDWDQFVHLISSGESNGGGIEPVPRRVRTLVSRSSRTVSRVSGPLKLAAINGSVKSVALTTLPQVQPSIVASKPTPIAKPISLSTAHPASVQHLMADDLVLELPKQGKLRNLPVVDNRSASIWRDRLISDLYWYAPVLTLIQPNPGDNPATSPFLFEYERSGVTEVGKPTLNGTVRFTLRKTMSAATQAALRGNRKAKAVPTGNLSVRLLIPFVDDDDGRLKTHTCTTKIQETGDQVTVTVSLLNDWVRLCYGVLAKAGFQASPVRLSISYSFVAYVPVREKDWEVVMGGKTLKTPIVYSKADAQQMVGRSYLDASKFAYHHPSGELRFQKELPQRDNVSSVDRAIDINRLSATSQVANIAIRPELTLNPNIANLKKEIKFATLTQLQRQHQNALFSCDRLGNFYRERLGITSTAIGCRDALQLGQTHYQQYEEIIELKKDNQYRIYRSLQQPGQFLVAPNQYCITRRSSTEPNAYDPLIILYALLDAVNAANNRVILDLTLQPRLTPATRRALLARLESYAHAPTLQYPTEIAVEDIEYSLNLGSGAINVEYETTGVFVHLSLETDLINWELLKTRLENNGILGSITVRLSDGSSLPSSSLALKLDQIWGPWDKGAVALDQDGRRLRLTNRIERPINLIDLMLYRGVGVATSLPLDITLDSGAVTTISLPQGSPEAYPTYVFPTVDPITIPEVRSFVEDIDRTFNFINLINFGNHTLERLDIEARIKNLEGIYTTQVTEEMPIAEIEMIMPLTTYLTHHILEFRVTKIFHAGTSSSITPWLEHNFAISGSIISLVWPMVE